MTSALASYASMSEIAQHSDQPRPAGDGLRVDGVVVEPRRNTKQDPALCPTDADAVVPRKKLEKRSFDYLWRSAVAGGLAGCAVSSSLLEAPLGQGPY